MEIRGGGLRTWMELSWRNHFYWIYASDLIFVSDHEVFTGKLTNIPIAAGQIGFRSWNAGNMLFDDVNIFG